MNEYGNPINQITFSFSILLTILMFIISISLIVYNLSDLKALIEDFTLKGFLTFVIPILIISFFSLYFPLIILFITFIVGCVSGFLCYQSTINYYLGLSNNSVYYLLKLLEQLRILSFIINLYFFSFIGSMQKFKIILYILNILAFLYALVTRWYFYNTVILKISFDSSILFLIYLALVISLMAVYFRFLISFSLILVAVCQKFPDLMLLTIEPEIPPSSGNKTSFISIDRSTNHHYHSAPPSIKIPLWRNGILITALFTLGVGSATAYYTYLQATYAEQQAISTQRQTAELERQTAELERQNDLQEVELGLRPKQVYLEKWPDHAKPQTAVEKHFPEAFRKKD